MPEQATILVVDDLPQNVRLLESILARRGLPRGRGEPGPEAREHVAAEPVDLVLLDIPDARDARVRGVPSPARRAAHELPARVNGADPVHLPLGTKTGCRCRRSDSACRSR